MAVLTPQRKVSFLIDDLLRDTHDTDKLPADTPAVITTGFPRYCFPPKNLSNCCYPDADYIRVPQSTRQLGSVSSPSDSDTESSKDPSEPAEHPEPPTNGKSRPSFSAHQVETLKSIFSHNHYLGKAERKQLADDLNMTDEQVKTWFQNKRTKLKKKMFAEVDEHYAKLLYLRDIVSGLPSEQQREYGFHGYPEYPGLGRPTISPEYPERPMPLMPPYFSRY